MKILKAVGILCASLVILLLTFLLVMSILPFTIDKYRGAMCYASGKDWVKQQNCINDFPLGWCSYEMVCK